MSENSKSPTQNITKTLEERGSRYGSFADNAAFSQAMKDIFRQAPSWSIMTPDQKDCLDHTAQKIARILTGDPFYADNWHDIQGYNRLVEENLPKEG